MRISPIGANLCTNQKNYSKNAVNPTEFHQPSFKEKGIATAGLGLVGLFLAILTGGILSWTVPVLSGLGYLCDKMSDKSGVSSNDNYNPSGYEDISGFDWIG